VLYSTPVFNDPIRSILIVDDDNMIAELLSAGFTRYGFKVHTAASGLEAWRIFEREHVDVVLTDICMPEMDGEELCRRVRERSPSTLVAVMTGGEFDVANALLHDGFADHFFQKPFDLMNICELLLADVAVT